MRDTSPNTSGVMRTAARIKLQWFWPGMMSEVWKTIKTCEGCQINKLGQIPKTTKIGDFTVVTLGRRRL